MFVVLLVCVFFFFQAEDGIRDDLVTGVQTCALPICGRSPPMASSPMTRATIRGVRSYRLRSARPSGARCATLAYVSAPLVPRSEERRVGKECRSRLAPSQ